MWLVRKTQSPHRVFSDDLHRHRPLHHRVYLNRFRLLTSPFQEYGTPPFCDCKSIEFVAPLEINASNKAESESS